MTSQKTPLYDQISPLDMKYLEFNRQNSSDSNELSEKTKEVQDINRRIKESRLGEIIFGFLSIISSPFSYETSQEFRNNQQDYRQQIKKYQSYLAKLS